MLHKDVEVGKCPAHLRSSQVASLCAEAGAGEAERKAETG